MTNADILTPEQREWEMDKAAYLKALEKKDIAFMKTMKEKRPECIDTWALKGLPALHYALKMKDLDFFIQVLDLGADTKINGRYSYWEFGREYYDLCLTDKVCRMAARDFAFVLLQRGEFRFDMSQIDGEKNRTAFKELYNRRQQIRDEYLKLTGQNVAALPETTKAVAAEPVTPVAQVVPVAQASAIPDPDDLSLEEKFNLVVIRLYETTDQLAQSQKLLARALEKLDAIEEREKNHRLDKPSNKLSAGG